MRRYLDTNLAQTIALLWVGTVVLLLIGYALFRWWRSHHPLAKPDVVLPYAKRLQQRLAVKRRRRAKHH